MNDTTHASPRSVTEAHRNSNIVILRFDPPLSHRKRRCTTQPLGMTVTIVRMGTGLVAEA